MRFTEVPLPPKALIVFAYLEVSMSTTSERCDASLFFHIHTYIHKPSATFLSVASFNLPAAQCARRQRTTGRHHPAPRRSRT